MEYNEALNYIHSLRWTGKKAGLSKTKEMLDMLGNPEKKLKFIHIAGTNGKGSAAAMLAAILQQAGYGVGLFTSPFIVRFNERIQYNFKEISEEELAELTEKVKGVVDRMEEPPSEFEVVTVIGFLFFLKMQCDIVVLETGLGGTFDSTNVIECPEVAVITTIGIDHKKELGATIEEIAAAKAGIIKPGCSVVFYGENEEAEQVIRTVCQKTGSSLRKPDFSKLMELSHSLQGQKFSYQDYSELTISLLGLYQKKNAALVIETVELLKEKGYRISREAVSDGLRTARWPVRFEVIATEPYIIVDGSHNPQGMAATMETVQEYAQGRRVFCVFGVMADKDMENMISSLLSTVTEVIAVQPEYPRAMEAGELTNKIQQTAERMNSTTPVFNGGKVADGMQLALSHCKKEDILLAVGSLYMAGEVLQWNYTKKQS